jgi:mono/diheme cytochrome c family protein
MRLILTVVLIGSVFASCKYGVADINAVPSNPTYNGDIYPLFRDHCLLCHGSPPNRGVYSKMRLDVYEDAKNYISSILDYVDKDKMPPAAKNGDGVGPNGKAMLHRWSDNGTPE